MGVQNRLAFIIASSLTLLLITSIARAAILDVPTSPHDAFWHWRHIWLEM